MTLKVDILISHPGKHHALHLVAGCAQSGASICYVTPFYRKGIGAVIAQLPGMIGSKAKGYFHPAIPLNCVVSPLDWQIKKLISLLNNNLSYERDFDLFVANAIETGKYQAKVLVTLQDYMPATVRAAKKRGWIIWSDQILNQSVEMATRVALHEKKLNLATVWQHSEIINDEMIDVADVITVPSRYTLDGINSRIAPNTHVYTIPYGASTKQFAGERLLDSEQIIILARAHSIRKGGHLFLKALQQCSGELLSACSQKKIKVIVLGSMEPVLSRLLAEINLPEGVTVEHGNVPHAQVAQLYQQASLFVMPSLSESMSLACVEALHAGLPLIITKYCGIDGFVSGEMGYEVEDNVESIAFALVMVCSNKNKWKSWERSVRKLATTLTWDAYEHQICRLVQTLI